MFLYAKDHGAERERDVTGLEKIYQTLQEYCSSQDLQYHTLSKDLEKLVQ